jgi:hypothetical protein
MFAFSAIFFTVPSVTYRPKAGGYLTRPQRPSRAPGLSSSAMKASTGKGLHSSALSMSSRRMLAYDNFYRLGNRRSRYVFRGERICRCLSWIDFNATAERQRNGSYIGFDASVRCVGDAVAELPLFSALQNGRTGVERNDLDTAGAELLIYSPVLIRSLTICGIIDGFVPLRAKVDRHSPIQ